MNKSFFAFLWLEALLGNLIWSSKAMRYLITAKDTICRDYELDFSYIYFLEKLDLFKEQFWTLKWMLGLDGVKYDATTNMVTAPNKVWHDIFSVSNLTMHLFLLGKEKLTFIFHMIHANVNNPPN